METVRATLAAHGFKMAKLFSEHILQHRVVEAQISDQLLQPAVLSWSYVMKPWGRRPLVDQ
jgi:hypothetical protein